MSLSDLTLDTRKLEDSALSLFESSSTEGTPATWLNVLACLYRIMLKRASLPSDTSLDQDLVREVLRSRLAGASLPAEIGSFGDVTFWQWDLDGLTFICSISTPAGEAYCTVSITFYPEGPSASQSFRVVGSLFQGEAEINDWSFFTDQMKAEIVQSLASSFNCPVKLDLLTPSDSRRPSAARTDTHVEK